MDIRVTNIQRFCLNDGPGIRTTVFLKGCNLHCPWCANPENLSYGRQYYYKKDKCNPLLCDKCKECIALQDTEEFLRMDVTEDVDCPFHAIGIYGRDYTATELLNEILKDQVYMKQGGGVTFSGGEALLQFNELEEVLKQLKEKGIHIAVETALFVPPKLLEIALKYVDFFYVDVKILEPDVCKAILGTDIALFLANVKKLKEVEKTVIFRVPGSMKYTLTDSNISMLKEFFLLYKGYDVELFQLHYLGQSKYESIGKMIWKDSGDVQAKLNELTEWLNSHGLRARIISIG